jgi:energy-coupling factor transporter ATP-binding protein EcfA2
VKIHKLWAENVKGITKKLELNLEATGLNVITAPNETGKTTLAQVLDYLFKFKSTANSKEIKDLKPYGKDVGPLMGAIIEVKGQTYKIEKQWLKDKKTEVELISPERRALSGNDADKVIDQIFNEYLDSTIWKMIQVAQADFSRAISEGYGEGQKDVLRHYLSLAVVDEDSASDETLYEKAETEYLKWWTPKDGKIAGGANSRGREITEKNKELRDLQDKVAKLKEKIADAAKVEAAIVDKQESREVLQRRKQAQDANKELQSATRELKKRSDLKADIEKLESETPGLKNFSPEIYEELEGDRALSAQFLALNSLSLKALKTLNLEINGKDITLEKGTTHEQKLESPLKISLADLLEIEYVEQEGQAEQGLEQAHNRYLGNLKLLGCSDFNQAKLLNRAKQNLASKSKELDSLLITSKIEDLQTIIDKNLLLKAELANWDFDITAPLVTVANLEEVAQQVGQKEGRAEEISRYGWHTELEESKEKISDYQKRLDRLNREARAARLLLETLDEHKSSAERDYSVNFSECINKIAKSYYGHDVEFVVSDSFEILRRRTGLVEVNVEDLSTGAKEQLAILIRLALTQIVQVDEPFPVILDDEFAHSDPERIALMDNVFKDFGSDQQFILFTCYPDKFNGYKPANVIELGKDISGAHY